MATKTKVCVEYRGGESRYSNKAVDYMLAVIPTEEKDIELYAELEALEDENGNYLKLKSMILDDAKEMGIDFKILEFPYDGQEGF